jgi:hypothetical protein
MVTSPGKECRGEGGWVFFVKLYFDNPFTQQKLGFQLDSFRNGSQGVWLIVDDQQP